MIPTVQSPELSGAQALVAGFRARFGAGAAMRLFDAWSRLTVIQRAALWSSREFRLRPSQRIQHGPWRSHGFMTGRRFGKTLSNCLYIQERVAAGDVREMGFCAQDEEQTENILVRGPVGLLQQSPPWNRATYTNGEVRWANGARAYPYTPERPSAFRGAGFQMFWASELQSWPRQKLRAAWTNLELMTTGGIAQIVWECTPIRRHSLIRARLKAHAADPALHLLTTGTIYDNRANLSRVALDQLTRDLKGTPEEQEELHGIFEDAIDGALWQAEWIDDHRCVTPRLTRKVLAIDPAFSMRANTDETGIVLAGRSADRRVHILRDMSGKLEWSAWGLLAVDTYLAEGCDCIVLERNTGSDAIAANIRSAAFKRSTELGRTIEVLELGLDETPPPHAPNLIAIRPVKADSSKATRADPVAVRYKHGQVSHAEGADLELLETQLIEWEPVEGEKSPNRLDACVWVVWELADMALGESTGAADVSAAQAMAEQHRARKPPTPQDVAKLGAGSGHRRTGLLGRGRGGGAT